MKPLYVQLRCHTQHNVYSHLDMYTSDVSRFKYRVNQPRMYRTNKHINTYRVYGSIISTNIHKPGRCTFFWLQQHPFLAKLLQHVGPFRCVPLMVHLYYYYFWMHIQPDWHICRSGIAIKMKCLRVLSINIDSCSKNYKPKNKKNYYMISKTNGLIDYMNRQHKGYSTMERTFHLWFTK